MELARAWRWSADHSGGGAYDSCPAPENSLPAPLAGVGTCGQMLSDMIQAENIAM